MPTSNVDNEIRRAFYSGSGPCEACPRRDQDCYSTPTFGYGSTDANIMLIGEASGGTETIDKSDLNSVAQSDRKRRWKNFRETGISHTKKPTEKSRSIEDLPIKELEYFVSDISNSNNIYYTNAAKCNDIHESDPEQPSSKQKIPSEYRKLLNGSGKRRCLQHLESELNQIRPEVAIVFSNTLSKDNLNHLETMFEFLGVDDPWPRSGTVKKYVYNREQQKEWTSFSVYYSSRFDCHVIPSYHFSNNFRYAQHPPEDIDDLGYSDLNYDSKSKRYLDELIKASEGTIDKMT